jgi:hypothetical protein
MANPCYNGPNPVKDEERAVIWKWAKEHGGIDDGLPINHVANAVNIKFFGGMAKSAWIDDILSGRKTPFKEVADEMWKKQYNRRVTTQQAQEISRLANMGPVAKQLRALWNIPRTIAVAGHGVVFPITHGGDLVFRPESWGTFIKGTLDTYKGAFSKSFTERSLSSLEREDLYDLGLRSGVDMGAGSHPSGLISRSYTGPAQRAWDMLTVMRFNLWKQAMSKWVKPEMTKAETLDLGKNLAEWANHATGSARGPIANVGGEGLFGPKLTQSKLSRVFSDPTKTVKTFANWENATPGERAVAWERMSGAAQFVGTNLAFLGINQGLLSALGQKDKINVTDPLKGDYMTFKGLGVLGNVPGLHTEVRTLAKILATSFESSRQLRGESRFANVAKIGGQYAMAKLHPTIQRGLEVGLGQNWLGRPLPWSSDPGTKAKPRLSWGEYAGSIGPIPLEGPVGYTYDHLRKTGASALDATEITKGLILTGLGATGVHVREDFIPTPTTKLPKLPQ